MSLRAREGVATAARPMFFVRHEVAQPVLSFVEGSLRSSQ
jgi:hypothetical protein